MRIVILGEEERKLIQDVTAIEIETGLEDHVDVEIVTVPSKEAPSGLLRTLKVKHKVVAQAGAAPALPA